MKIYHGFKEARDLVVPNVYAIGNFDGIHLGHAALLAQAKSMAKEMNVGFGIYTFWPHPNVILRPESRVSLICTRDQKIEQLKMFGVDYLIEEPFTLSFSKITAQQFAEDIVHKSINAVAVVTGRNFHFGHKALGTSDCLAKWLNPFGVECFVANTVVVADEVCSSSRIRKLVELGDVSGAGKLLGRNFSIVGQVIIGSGRGKGIGIPTANIKPESTLIPKPGVYKTLVRINDSNVLLKGATNIGVRPTFDGNNDIQIETHLIDFDKDIYGEKIEVYFVNKLRDEKKFENIEALVAQIQRDIELVSQ